MPRSRDYITNLAATGRYHFTVEEMGKALAVFSLDIVEYSVI